MTDFVCRTHKKAFLSLKALSEHIDRQHSDEGMIHCSYRDTGVVAPSARRSPTRDSAQLSAFVGHGLTQWKPRTGPPGGGEWSAQEATLVTVYELYFEAPRFIVDAVRGMKNKRMMTQYPDVHVRYTKVCQDLDATPDKLKREARLKRAVFSILLPR